MDRVCVSRISMKHCKIQGRTPGSQGGLDKGRKMSGKERKVKNACGWKMPTQNRSARGKKITEWKVKVKMKVSRITLRWAGLKLQNVSKNLAIVHGRVRDDVEKKMWMKNINKWRIATTTKWRSTSQKPPEVLPTKYHQ